VGKYRGKRDAKRYEGWLLLHVRELTRTDSQLSSQSGNFVATLSPEPRRHPARTSVKNGRFALLRPPRTISGGFDVKRTTYAVALLAALGALVIAGCGGGGSSGGTESRSGEVGGSTGGGTVAASEVPGLGAVLVDSSGMTVYEFTVDKGTTSNCYGECEAAWPPVTATGKPSAGEGAVAGDLGTTKRKDGTVQVTYKGHPLYTFAEDDAPGEANGNELDGTWFALSESGVAVKGQATPAAATSEAESEPSESSEESSGGYGY
jgi:predicted lipoprotein with Yx(FWY)xxD motif